MRRRVLVPLPDRDFDTTEVAVPWRVLTDAGHDVCFATATGERTPACDPRLLTGVLFGQLGADEEPRRFYRALTEAPAFVRPASWSALRADDFDALVLPGGHAKGMRPYLEDRALASLVVDFFAAKKLVGAICHGTIVCARARTPDGRSVLWGHKTTALPKYMEQTAYALTFWKLGDYYRTYPAYVEDEVRAALASRDDFVRGPLHLVSRGTMQNDRAAFVVESGPYVSARWPGDAYRFARVLRERLG